MHRKKLYGTATVGSKGQIVIPVEARESMGIASGDKLYVFGSDKMKWIGLVQEDTLRDMLGHLVGDVESFRDALDDADKEKE